MLAVERHLSKTMSVDGKSVVGSSGMLVCGKELWIRERTDDDSMVG